MKIQKRQIRTALRRARKLIDEVGWCQGISRIHNLEGKVTGYCMVGALSEVCKTRQLLKHSAFDYLGAVLKSNDKNEINKIVNYNDSPNRRKRDVLKKFDKALTL